jgi:hypothetical protein
MLPRPERPERPSKADPNKQSGSRDASFLIDTKVLNDTFVHLFGFNASGEIALSRRSQPEGA